MLSNHSIHIGPYVNSHLGLIYKESIYDSDGSDGSDGTIPGTSTPQTQAPRAIGDEYDCDGLYEEAHDRALKDSFRKCLGEKGAGIPAKYLEKVLEEIDAAMIAIQEEVEADLVTDAESYSISSTLLSPVDSDGLCSLKTECQYTKIGSAKQTKLPAAKLVIKVTPNPEMEAENGGAEDNGDAGVEVEVSVSKLDTDSAHSVEDN